MDTLKRACGSRHGGRSFVMKLLTKAEVITEAGNQVTPLQISEVDRETIDLVQTQILAKKTQLEELEQTIAAALTKKQELEDEVIDAEMYHFSLAEHINKLQKFTTATVAKKNTYQQEQVAENTTNGEQQATLQNNLQETEDHDEEVTTSNPVSHDLQTHTRLLYVMWGNV